LLYKIKRIVRRILPGRIVFLNINPLLSKKIAFQKGYAGSEIFENLVSAHSQTQFSDTEFERDGVICQHPDYDFYILVQIYNLFETQDNVTVLDIGGGMASKYYQNKKYLKTLNGLKWITVEQQHIVNFCRKNIDDKNLLFFTLDEVIESQISSDLLLISSTLQYLEKPYSVFSDLLSSNPKKIIIDKTPFIDEQNDKQMIQKLPKEIYRAQYICWFFSDKKFKEFF